MLGLVLWLLAAEPVITKPNWREPPSADDLAAFYPPEARMRGIEGKATIECTVTVEGTLTSCAVVSEEPADAGFGAATVQVAAKFRMTPKTVDGKPVGDGTVRIPINWSLGATDTEASRAWLAEAEACVGYAQARVPSLRGAGPRDLFLYRYWVSAYVVGASDLKPSEFARRIEALRVDAAAKLAAGGAMPEACLKTPIDEEAK